MRRLASRISLAVGRLRLPQGVLGVTLLAVGVWEVFGWGWALVVVGGFFLVAELLRSN